MNPFMSIQTPVNSSIGYIGRVILLIIKLPIFMILIAELIVTNDLLFRRIQSLPMNIYLHKSLRAIILIHNFIIGRLLLLLIGFFRYRSIFSLDNQSCKVYDLQSYCFYCSRSSPVDTIVYITYFSPTFTHFSFSQIKNKILYQTISYTEAIYESFFQSKCGVKSFENGEEIQDLYKFIKEQRMGPLIIYWQGGITNGYSFLNIDKRFLDELNQVKEIFKQQNYKFTNYFSTQQGFLFIFYEDKITLINKTPFEMIINLLTNIESHLEMNFFTINGTQNGEQRYKEYVENVLKRRISKKNWKDYNTLIQRQ